MDLKNLRTLLVKFAEAPRTEVFRAGAKVAAERSTLVVDVGSYAASVASLWRDARSAELYANVVQVFLAAANAGFKLVGVLGGGISPSLAAKHVATGLVPATAGVSAATLVVEQALRDAGATCIVSTVSAEALIAAYARENAASIFGVLSDNPVLLLHNVGHIIFADSFRIQPQGRVLFERHATEGSLAALRKAYGRPEAPSTLQRAQFAALLSRAFLDTDTVGQDARYAVLDLALVLLNLDREISLVDFDTFKVVALTTTMAETFEDLTSAYRATLDAVPAAADITLSAATAPWVQPQLVERMVSAAVPGELRQLALSGLAVAASDELAPHFFRASAEAMFVEPAGRSLAWANLAAKSVHIISTEENSTAQGWNKPSEVAGLAPKGKIEFAWSEIKKFDPRPTVSETLKFFQQKIPENIANKADMAVFATALTHALFEGAASFNAGLLGRLAATGVEGAPVPAANALFTTDKHEEMGGIAVDLNSVLAEEDWDAMDDSKLLFAARNSQGFRILQSILNPTVTAPPSIDKDEVKKFMEAFAVAAQPAFDEVLQKHFGVERASLKIKKGETEKIMSAALGVLQKNKEELSLSLVKALQEKTGDAALDLLHLAEILKADSAWIKDAARAHWKTLTPAERKAALEKMSSSSNKPIDKFRPPKVYPNQEKVLTLVDEQLSRLKSDSSATPLHVIFSTPTGSGKTFTTLLINRMVMNRHGQAILVYSVPTKQVMKRVGTDVEANQVPYWTAGFAHEGSFAVRRPHSIRTVRRENPLKKAGMLAMLVYTRKTAIDAKDKNGGKPLTLLADIKATAELLRVASLIDRLYSDLSDDTAAKLVADELRNGLRSDIVEVKKVEDKDAGKPTGGDDAEEKEKKKRDNDPIKVITEIAAAIEDRETRKETLEKLKLESFTSTNLALFYDEPNMGLHLNVEIAQTTKKIVAHLPKTAILASATMPDWDKLPKWWGGSRPDIRHEIVSEAPYGLPINKLHHLDLQDAPQQQQLVEEQQQQQQQQQEQQGDTQPAEGEEPSMEDEDVMSTAGTVSELAGDDATSSGPSGCLRAASVFDVFPTHADFAKFTAESDETQFAKLLRHFTPQQTNALLPELNEATSTSDSLCSSVKDLRKTSVAPRVKSISASEFSNLRNTWSDFKGTVVKHVRDVISKEGITLVATMNPDRVARQMTGIAPADWRKAENSMRRIIQAAKTKQSQLDREHERATSGKGKRREGDEDVGREATREVYEAKVGQLRLTVEELERASLEALVLLSKGVAGSYKGVDPFVEQMFQQAVLAIPESRLDKVAARPPIYVLVVDYGSVYGMDCPGVDTVIACEDLAASLSQDDLVQLLGRLRRDGRVIFRSFGSLSTAITTDRACERWKLRLQEEVREFVRTVQTEKQDVKTRIAAVKRFARRLYEGVAPSMGQVLGEIIAALVMHPFREARTDADHARIIQVLLKDWKATLEQLGGIDALDQVHALRAMERALRVSPAVEKSANFLNFVYSTCEFDVESVLLWREDILRDVTSSDRFWRAAEAFVQLVEEESEGEEEEDD